MLHSFAESHIGQRKVNEDSFLIDDDLGLYIVADGVGGMSKGEVASRLVCEATANCVKSGQGLKQAVQSAHQKIVDQIKSDTEKQGMASTIVAVLFKDNSYEVAWVGDSRVYIWDKELKLITRDDSYVELLFENGHIGIEDLDTHPDRNVISQAMGIVRKDIKINYNEGTLENNQVLLLCSDGLYSVAVEKDIIDGLKSDQDIQQLTESLVKKAVEKNGKDNITLLSVISDHDSSDANGVVNPKVFREFDSTTGKVKNYDEQKAGESDNQDVIVYMDPELVDQTKLEDLTPEEKDRLDTAAHQFVNKTESNAKRSSKITPLVLVSILGLIGVLLVFYKISG